MGTWWTPFAKVICEISPTLAKGQSARDYVLTMEDYSKISFHAQYQLKEKHYNQLLEFPLWSGNHGIWWKLQESDKSFFLYALKILQKPNPCIAFPFINEKQPYQSIDLSIDSG